MLQLFQFFPSCCGLRNASFTRSTQLIFQFFPSCCWSRIASRLGSETLPFNSFPIAALCDQPHQLHVRFPPHVSPVPPFNSFPVAADLGERPLPHRPPHFQFFPSCCTLPSSSAALTTWSTLQFFPSCCVASEPTPTPASFIAFNSFPVAAGFQRERWAFPAAPAFQFFPSCCLRILYYVVVDERSLFQFFPSCCSPSNLPFRLSQMRATPFNSFPVAARRPSLPRRPLPAPLAFNSFPVAAEPLARSSLISFSSANFEVHENLPALPPVACVDSRKPFPDSRRKEGRWRERNGV